MPLSRRRFVEAVGLGSALSLVWRPAPAAAGQVSVADGIKLDSNENPYGPGPAALAAIERALPAAARYLRNTPALVRAIAERHRVDPSMVLLSAGSGDLLRAAVIAFTTPERGLVLPHPTFEMAAGAAARLGHPVTAVPVDADLRMDVPALRDAARGAGLLYLCNPNNPTSTSVPGDAIAATVASLAGSSPQTTVLVDEAYDDYAADPAYRTVIDLVRTQPRLVVVRTFSKIHGMAGLRVGYAIGQPDLLAPMRAALPAMALNVLGVAAATASLADTAHLARQVALNAETRARTVRLFESLGCRVARSDTNFVMVDVRRPCTEFQASCAAERVFVGRPFPPLDTWSRITIGTAEEMTRALDVFARVLRPASA